jgi:glucosamine--fructose-6-phosphate aminotransferase (isomerizing)
MLEALDALEQRHPRLVVISDDERALARGQVALPLWTRVPEWLSPLVAVVPGQLAALQLARLRGIDLDNPLGLSKVTLTR